MDIIFCLMDMQSELQFYLMDMQCGVYIICDIDHPSWILLFQIFDKACD